MDALNSSKAFEIVDKPNGSFKKVQQKARLKGQPYQTLKRKQDIPAKQQPSENVSYYKQSLYFPSIV